MESDSKSPSIPWTPLLALVAAVAGLAALLPARSARPPAAAGERAPLAPQEVSARLWQDPLSVAREAHAKERERQPKEPTVLEGWLRALKDGKPPAENPGPLTLNQGFQAFRELCGTGSRPQVLVVSESGSPYAEDVERRIRDRVAVVHALAAEGYVPEQSTRLRYAVDGHGPDRLLPYEGFLPLFRIGETRQPVFVLWLADGTLGDHPLQQLMALTNLLGGADQPPPELLLIGPSNSLQYRRMLEAAPVWDDNPFPPLAPTRVFSCKASASEKVVAGGIDWLEKPVQDVPGKLPSRPARPRWRQKDGTAGALAERLSKRGGKFEMIRTICDDAQLSAALWQELRQRGVKPGAPVAAVTELDSFFGRASTLAFLHARKHGPRPTDPLDLRQANAQSPWVETFTHLAGIDGALPKNAFGAGDPGGKESAENLRASALAHEATEGFGQVDYLRRLGDELARENRRLNVQGGGKDGKFHEMSAVAVLGSDIYDKLQILRTLRPRVPAAHFVTLGLEARFNHPDEWRETRNLLVASNYALGPDRPDEREAPAFRDSIQTAVYAAVRLALGGAGELKVNLPWRGLGRPRLFEIGRGGPVPLPTRQVPDADLRRTIGWVNPGWILVCIPFVSLLGILLLVSNHPLEKRRWFERSRIAAPVALLASLILTALRYQLQPPESREPFALLDGISIWPGDFVRLSALLLALHFVAKILRQLRDSRDGLQEDFGIAPVESKNLLSTANPPWRRWWENFWPQQVSPHQGCDKVNVQDWWLRYRTWNGSGKRLGRAGVLAVLYFGALTTWTAAFSEPWPNLPVRGSAAPWSTMILMGAVLLSLFVTFLVVDATELNWRSIRDLNAKPTDWGGPPEAAPDFQQHRRLLEPVDFADYLDIELIACRSAVVNRLIYYPFILLTLLVAARWTVVDHYLWPPALLTAFGVNAAWAVYCAVRLPIEANRARDNSLRRLRARLYEQECAEAVRPPVPRSSAAALKGVITQIKQMHHGAFVGIWEQPVLRAFLASSGSAGIGALLEFLPR